MAITINQFKNLKRQIDKILETTENEAIKKGVDITSSEYLNALFSFKKRILAKRGISIEEYEEMENNIEVEADEGMMRLEVKMSNTERRGFEKEIEQVKYDVRLSLKETEKIMEKVKSDFLEDVQAATKSTQSIMLKEEDVINIVVPLIPTIPEPEKFDPSAFIAGLELLSEKVLDIQEEFQKSLGTLTKRVITDKELAEKEIAKKQTSNFSEDETIALRNLASPQGMQENIDLYGMPAWRKLAMGLQQQIDDAGKTVAQEIPVGTINGSNTVFTITAGKALVALFLNGVFQITTTHYTVSGTTITYVNAPPTGTEHIPLAQ